MKPTEIIVGFFSGGDSRGRLDSKDLPKDSLAAPKASVGAPNGNKNHLKSGIHTVTSLFTLLGPDRALDKRTVMGKALERWRQELIADLGGDENISAQQRGMIFQQPSLIDKRKRALLPAVRERQSLAIGLAEYLDRLGLECRRRGDIHPAWHWPCSCMFQTRPGLKLAVLIIWSSTNFLAGGRSRTRTCDLSHVRRTVGRLSVYLPDENQRKPTK